MVVQDYTNEMSMIGRMRWWLAQRLLGEEASTVLIKAVQQQEREACVRLIEQLAAEWGHTAHETAAAVIKAIKGRCGESE